MPVPSGSHLGDLDVGPSGRRALEDRSPGNGQTMEPAREARREGADLGEFWGLLER